MHVQYTGPDESRDLALPGGFLTFGRGMWVDIEEACGTTGIAADYLTVIIPTLGPDWETRPTPKTVKQSETAKVTAKET